CAPIAQAFFAPPHASARTTHRKRARVCRCDDRFGCVVLASLLLPHPPASLPSVTQTGQRSLMPTQSSRRGIADAYEPATSSARALRGPGRRHRGRRFALGRLPPRLLLARARALATLPPAVPAATAPRLRRGQAVLLRRARAPP